MAEQREDKVAAEKPGDPFWSAERSRKIKTRWVVEGDLVLQTPAHFGNGDGAGLTDMPLLKAADNDKVPLLTGASIAGALRAYLRSHQLGYRIKPDKKTKERDSAAVRLFGGAKGDAEGMQSPLIVEDAYGTAGAIETRNGVKLNAHSRTAENNALFNLEAWPTGTSFPLRVELLVSEDADEAALLSALVTALQGFNDGGITLGARKSRGFGRATVGAWRVKPFHLESPVGLADWLLNGAEKLSGTPVATLSEALKGTQALPDDKRNLFTLTAKFALDGSLLVRSGGGRDDIEPDMVHTTSNGRPVLPGTSLAGALRARASKISNTLAANRKDADALMDYLFGRDMHKADEGGVRPQPTASRISVEEHEVTLQPNVAGGGRFDLVQSRVAIDRFTGGALDTALFTEQPVFGGDHTEVQVCVKLINPHEYDVGLLLLLLKDLWTGDLPLGGEISVGRGRLKGKEAVLAWKARGIDCTIRAQGDALQPVDGATAGVLNGFVKALKENLNKHPTATKAEATQEVNV